MQNSQTDLVIPLFASAVQISRGVALAVDYSLDTVEWSEARSNRVSTHTDLLRTPEFAQFLPIAEAALDRYRANTVCTTTQFHITNSWLALSTPGQSHHRHSHPNSVLSGVIYLDTDPTHISFHGTPGIREGYDFEYECTEYTPFNSTQWNVPVCQGDCVVFPSHLDHSTPEVTSTRLILGFNSFPRGQLHTDYAGDLTL